MSLSKEGRRQRRILGNIERILKDLDDVKDCLNRIIMENGDSISDSARALSRLGSSAGGIARANKLSPERRKEIAQNAAKTRWQNKRLDINGFRNR